MAIYCSVDGTQHPGDANFCSKCGRPLREGLAPAPTQRPMRWEYTDLEIPLDHVYVHDYGTSLLSLFSDPDAKNRENKRRVLDDINRIVLNEIQRAAAGGWEPEGPTDLASLSGNMRVERGEADPPSPHKLAIKYVSVTIRLKRVLPT